jgi:predicted methyltransferase
MNIEKEYRNNWARLIQKIYEVDPLTCAKCQGRIRIIAFIEDEEVIKKILRHTCKENPSTQTRENPSFCTN